jgi:hypothetical protein
LAGRGVLAAGPSIRARQVQPSCLLAALRMRLRFAKLRNTALPCKTTAGCWVFRLNGRLRCDFNLCFTFPASLTV